MMHKVRTMLAAGAMVLPVATVELYGQMTEPGQQRQGQQERTPFGQQQGQRAQPGQRAQQGQIGQPGQRAQQGQQADRQTQQALAADLKLANQAEIQLSQLAQRQAENQQVKQYAQQMIQAHQQLNQQLAQAMPTVRQVSLPGAQDGQQAQAGQGQQEPQGALGQAGQAAARQGQEIGEAGRDVFGMAGGAQDNTMIQIQQQVYSNLLDRQKQTLNEKSGAEFDKAFMGYQMAAHEAMLAKLQAYEQHVPQDAQQVLQQAQQETRQHLQEAEQIMQQLDQGSGQSS